MKKLLSIMILLTLIMSVTGVVMAEDLEITHDSSGELQKIFKDIVSDFEKEKDVEIELIRWEAQHYVNVGLRSKVMADGHAPDIYKNWGGSRMGRYVDDGYAYNLTEFVTEGPLKDMFSEGSLASASYKDGVYMLPFVMSLNAHFYNVKMFEKYDLEPPETWEEYLNICEKLKQKGVTPIIIGNKGLWAGTAYAGLGIQRIVGVDRYQKTFRREDGYHFNDPGFVKALSYFEELAAKGYFNSSIDAISSNEGNMSFFQGLGAMTPIGSWITSQAIDSAPEDFEMDVFILPPLPEGKGDPGVILGGATGWMVGESEDNNTELALDFMEYMYELENQQRFVKDAGLLSPVQGAMTKDNSSSLLLKLSDIINNSTGMINWQDRVYDEGLVEKFETAVAKVLSGAQSAEEALNQCERDVEAYLAD